MELEKTPPLSTRLTWDVDTQLQRYCTETGARVSDVLQDACRWLADNWGRLKIYPAAKKHLHHHHSARVDYETREEYKRLASEKGWKLSDFIRTAIVNYLKYREHGEEIPTKPQENDQFKHHVQQILKDLTEELQQTGAINSKLGYELEKRIAQLC